MTDQTAISPPHPPLREPLTANVCTALLAVILVVAAWIRLRHLGGDALWRDEATSWAEARGSLADIIAATAQDNYPPLHNLILAATMRLFGDSEWALRLPSVILGTLNVAALYWVGRLAAGRTAGLIAATLLALSPFAIFYAQEVRMYALLALAATLLAGCGLWLVERPTWPRAIATFLAGATLLYSHPYGIPTWLCLDIAIAITISGDNRRQRVTVWLVTQLAAAVAFAPWAWVLFTRARAVEQASFWVPFPAPAYVVGEIVQLAGDPAMLTLLLVGALAAFVGVAISPRSTFAVSGRVTIALLLWGLGPLVIGVAASAVGTPVFVARYIIGSLPALLLLAAIGFTVPGVRRNAGILAAIAVACFCLATAMPVRPEDWRSAIAYVKANLQPSDCLLVPDDLAANVIAYYFRPPPACFADAARADFQLAEIAAPRIVAIVVGSKGNTIATLPPPWQDTGAADFRGIRVVTFTRP